MLQNSLIAYLVCISCSSSSLVNVSVVDCPWVGRIFCQTHTMHIVKLSGKSIRKTADLSLNRLKSSIFR